MAKNGKSDVKKIIFDVVDPLTATISVFAPDDFEIAKPLNTLYVTLCYFDPSVVHTWRFQNKMTDGKVYFFHRQTQTFSIGLVAKVYKILKERHPDYKIEFTLKLRDVFTPPGGKISIEKLEEFTKGLNIYNYKYDHSLTPYDYQYKLVLEAINTRRVSLMAATGAGKSICLYILSRYLYDVEKKDVLLIVPSQSLVEQIYSDFKDEYGWLDIDKHCSMLHGEVDELKMTARRKAELEAQNMTRDDLLKNIVISTWQSLQNKAPDFFDRFGGILIDECHSAKAEVITKICNLSTNATLKIGVSGTLPETGLDSALIESCLGERKVIIKTKELIERGILTPTEILAIKIPYEESAKKIVHRADYDGQVALTSYNGSKTEVFKMLIDAEQIKQTQNTILLYKYTDTLEMACKYFSENYPHFKCIIYDGNVGVKERERFRKELEDNCGYLVFATYGTMKQGINVKRIHNIYFAECSKSLTTVIQSIGRGIRKCWDKLLLRVFDPFDDCSYWTKPRKEGNTPTLKRNYSLLHYEKRLEYYEYDEFPIKEFTFPKEMTVDVITTNLFKEAKANKRKKSPSKKSLTERVDERVSKAKFSDFF